jgi:hypothetical protein
MCSQAAACSSPSVFPYILPSIPRFPPPVTLDLGEFVALGQKVGQHHLNVRESRPYVRVTATELGVRRQSGRKISDRDTKLLTNWI